MYFHKFIIILLLILFAIGYAAAQTGHNASATDTKSKVKQAGKSYNQNYFVKNKEARYKFGEDSLYKYIYDKLYATPEFLANTKEGNILIAFEVNFDTKIMNVGIIEGLKTPVDDALKTIITDIKDFVPAQQNNIDYRSEIILDIPIKPR